MTRSKAIEIISRRLNINAGRLAALTQRAAEAGELPKAVGRSVPDLAPIGLAKLLLCAIADRGLGGAAASVREFSCLRTDGGATLIDLLEGLINGAVTTKSLHSIIVQLEPAAVTCINLAGRLHYGPTRSRDGAARVVVVPGSALRAIVAEFRGQQAA
jgi:hypothetical protein